MKKKRLPGDMMLSEDQVRDVIERAAREVPESSGITVAELQQIAAELDISPKALERALDDVVGLNAADRPVRGWLDRQVAKLGRHVDPFLPRRGCVVLGAIFGGVAGWLNAFLMTFAINGHYAIAAAMVGITFANLLSRRRGRQFPRFLAETLVLWVAYAVAWSATYGGVTQNLIVWVALWTSMATLFGSLLLRDPGAGDGDISAETSSSQDALATRADRPILPSSEHLRMQLLLVRSS
ncbi:MAG TPA: hypothetical protein VMN60_05375 [Longimicrobiales bacterium]|nr:hypothetical protein [Longimicrobiales bacterium]